MFILHINVSNIFSRIVYKSNLFSADVRLAHNIKEEEQPEEAKEEKVYREQNSSLD